MGRRGAAEAMGAGGVAAEALGETEETVGAARLSVEASEIFRASAMKTEDPN